MSNNQYAEVYTDGSCHTQLCVGGWAAIVFVDGEKIVLSGKEENTTHNRMELLAVINATEYILENFKTVKEIRLVSDSQYVIGLIRREAKFNASAYTTKAGKDIRNVDLVKRLLALTKMIGIQFEKIKAHQKQTEIINYNIEVDKLCRQIVREAVKGSL
jgi:ribonuclease HI